jgi:hypothetical protein
MFAAVHESGYGPNPKSTHVRCYVSFQGQSRLVLLTLSSSGFDPKATSSQHAVCCPLRLADFSEPISSYVASGMAHGRAGSVN